MKRKILLVACIISTFSTPLFAADPIRLDFNFKFGDWNQTADGKGPLDCFKNLANSLINSNVKDKQLSGHMDVKSSTKQVRKDSVKKKRETTYQLVGKMSVDGDDEQSVTGEMTAIYENTNPGTKDISTKCYFAISQKMVIPIIAYFNVVHPYDLIIYDSNNKPIVLGKYKFHIDIE